MRVSGALLLALVAPAAAMGPSWMPLVYGLGSAWVLVMTLVIVSFCCCRGGTFTNIETTAPAGQGAVPAGQSLIRFRKVLSAARAILGRAIPPRNSRPRNSASQFCDGQSSPHLHRSSAASRRCG